MSLDSFKSFVKQRPNLIKYVDSGKKTWQDFYNLYELYGDKKDVWDKYLDDSLSSGASLGAVTLKDLFDNIKNVDVSSIRDSISSMQKGINYISDLVKEKESNLPKTSSFSKRPMYKYFDD